MIIKKGTEIEVVFTATALEDLESLNLMNAVMNELPGVRVFNPSYREYGKAAAPQIIKSYKQYDVVWQWMDKVNLAKKGYVIVKREEGITERSAMKTLGLGLIFLPLALFGTNKMVKITYEKR